jgi:endonuclease/exonuclease/phosphatase family metal-dependent hydrolase
MQVLSWNVKSFVSAVTLGGNFLDVLLNVINAFDLVVLYEVPNTPNGDTNLANLLTKLNPPPPVLPIYHSFAEPTLGIGKENDQVAVIWDSNAATVANTTGARRGLFSTTGRAPVYFDVTELVSGNMQEFCAWHAPQEAHANLISQGWQNLLRNTQDNHQNPLTAVIMGDFNADLTLGRRGPARAFQKQINAGAGTTLKPGVTTTYPTTQAYRTTNVYDQFFVDPANAQVNNVGIYDILNKLATNAAPFTGLFGTQYNSPRKAYDFYKRISDHIPVALDVTL